MVDNDWGRDVSGSCTCDYLAVPSDEILSENESVVKSLQNGSINYGKT